MRIAWFGLSVLLVRTGWAEGYGSAMSVMSVSLSLIFNLCLLAGLLFIGMGLVRYHIHRQNPTEMPWSRVIYVTLFGVAMLVLPYIIKKASIHEVIETTAQSTEANS